MYSSIQGILNKDTNDIIKVNSNLEVETLTGKKYKGKYAYSRTLRETAIIHGLNT